MTDNEIRRNYNEAKNKKMQIGILADMNCCTRAKIREIVGANANAEPQPDCDLKQNEDNQSQLVEWVHGQLDVIDSSIKELEEKYKKYVAVLEVLEEFEQQNIILEALKN
jgi:hypothetical protein